jgi:hypothetical protein
MTKPQFIQALESAGRMTGPPRFGPVVWSGPDTRNPADVTHGWLSTMANGEQRLYLGGTQWPWESSMDEDGYEFKCEAYLIRRISQAECFSLVARGVEVDN